jgi:hypothetical protein
MLSKSSVDENRLATTEDLAVFISRDLPSSGISYVQTAEDEAAIVQERRHLHKEKTKRIVRLMRISRGVVVPTIFFAYCLLYYNLPTFRDKLPGPMGVLLGGLISLIIISLFALLQVRMFNRILATTSLNWRIVDVDNGCFGF